MEELRATIDRINALAESNRRQLEEIDVLIGRLNPVDQPLDANIVRMSGRLKRIQ